LTAAVLALLPLLPLLLLPLLLLPLVLLPLLLLPLLLMLSFFSRVIASLAALSATARCAYEMMHIVSVK
jgi:hypothetical protein